VLFRSPTPTAEARQPGPARDFTPNRDGISDRVRVGYYLSKEVNRVDVYLTDSAGLRYPIAEDQIRESGAQGPHEHDYDGGVDLGAQPPPDGVYTVVVEAEVVNAAAEWSTSVVELGDTVSFTCTVKNIGTVAVRTKGPEPGETYRMDQNYNTLGQPEEPGLFRVGLDYEGNSGGRQYPFRWQLGYDDELTEINGEKYLMPGQTVTVTGHLVVNQKTVRVEPYFWLGLIHESVWLVQDRVEYTQIKVEF